MGVHGHADARPSKTTTRENRKIMKTTLHSSFLAKAMSLGSLLLVMACASEDPNAGKSQDQVTGQKSCADDEEEANDKITCSVDTDCDADEYCSNGLCAGLDGEDEDDECEADDDDEGGADKITCSVDADCDADEYCSNGLCTGLDGEDEN
jgi:hypothetical protein